MLYDTEKFIKLGKTLGLEGAEFLAFVQKQQELALEEKRREEEREEKPRRGEEKEERLRIAEEEKAERRRGQDEENGKHDDKSEK